MSDVDATDRSDSAAGHGHGHDDGEAEPLGEVDVTLWGAAVVGAAIAALLLIAMYVAIQA